LTWTVWVLWIKLFSDWFSIKEYINFTPFINKQCLFFALPGFLGGWAGWAGWAGCAGWTGWAGWAGWAGWVCDFWEDWGSWFSDPV
jgi:hypothetical protein